MKYFYLVLILFVSVSCKQNDEMGSQDIPQISIDSWKGKYCRLFIDARKVNTPGKLNFTFPEGHLKFGYFKGISGIHSIPVKNKNLSEIKVYLLKKDKKPHLLGSLDQLLTSQK